MILPFDVAAICGFRATLLSYFPIASRIELSLFGKCSDFIPNRKVIRQIYITTIIDDALVLSDILNLASESFYDKL